MRIFKLGTFAVAATALSLTPAYGQGRGGSHAAPTVSHGNPHTTSTSPTTTTTSSGSTTTAGSTTTGSTSTTTAPTLNPIAAKITSHPQLATRLTALLPKGTNLNDASSGFRNQGQFIAALHVSQNLKIPFTELKDTMLGTTTTPPSPMSLGQAIHKLRPTVNSTSEVNVATSQTSTDLRTTTTTTTSGK